MCGRVWSTLFPTTTGHSSAFLVRWIRVFDSRRLSRIMTHTDTFAASLGPHIRQVTFIVTIMMQEDVEEGKLTLEATESIHLQQQPNHYRRRIFSSASRSKYLENSLADQISQTVEVANQSAGTSNASGQIFSLFACLLLAAIIYGAMSFVFR